MSEKCPVCGLDLDLCVCEGIAREEQRIKVYLETRRYGKKATVIKGIDPKMVDINALVSTLKAELACGGTSKDGVIILQGDHRFKIKDLLVNAGFPPENIDVQI